MYDKQLHLAVFPELKIDRFVACVAINLQGDGKRRPVIEAYL